jgi:flagella synthesis protein FlgN
MEHLQALFVTAEADAKAFVALLDLEQQALINRDMTELEVLLTRKAPLVSALSEHDKTIVAYCQQAGIKPGDSLEEHLAVSGSAELLSSYHLFKNALQLCQTANSRNARLIRHNQQATGQLLDLLRNQGESSDNVYDSQGLSSRSGTQRNLTKV